MRSAIIVLFGIGVGVGLSSLASRFIGQADGKEKIAPAASGAARTLSQAPVETPQYRPPMVVQPRAPEAPREESTERMPAARPDLSTPPADLDKQHQAERERLIDEHDREPRNRKWASEAEAKLTENLAVIGKGKFEAVRVDCRSSTCMATVEWPSYREARAGHMDLLHMTTAVNCIREITVPPPADPEARYQGTMVMTNCTIDGQQPIQQP